MTARSASAICGRKRGTEGDGRRQDFYNVKTRFSGCPASRILARFRQPRTPRYATRCRVNWLDWDSQDAVGPETRTGLYVLRASGLLARR